MHIEEVLKQHEAEIVADVCVAVGRVERYRLDGDAVTRRRVEALTRRVFEAACTQDVTELRRYAQRLARKRSAAGFDLADVQAALSALESAVWRVALAPLPPYERAWALGLVDTALAFARTTISRAFAFGAPFPVPPLDLRPLFTGLDPAVSPDAEEMVYPV